MKLVLVSLIVLTVSLPGVVAEQVAFTVMHTNDSHTRFLNDSGDPCWGDVARIAALIQEVRAEVPNSVLLDAGDWSEGTFFHMIGGTSSLDLTMKEMLGYDAITIGNHDYLYSAQFLYDKITNATLSFPILLANADFTEFEELGALLQRSMIIDLGTIQVGIFGLTTDEFIYAQFLEPATVTDPEDTAVEMIEELTVAGAEVVICLSHLGFSEDVKLIEEVAGIDLLVGGHSHTRLFEPHYVTDPAGNDIPIVQAMDWYHYLGRADVAYDTTTDSLTVSSYSLLPSDCTVDRDATIASFLDEQIEAIETAYGNVFKDAIAETTLDLYEWGAEMPLGNFVADAFYNAAITEGYLVDATVAAGNFIASGIPYGIINSADVLGTYPYGFDPYHNQNATIVIGDVPGYLLQVAVGMLTNMGLFVHSSNMEIVYDPTTTAFPLFLIDGEPLDPQANYTIGFNNIEIATITYLGFNLENVVDTGLECWEVLAEAFAAASPITPEDARIEGRLRYTPPDLTVFREDLQITPREPLLGEIVKVSVPVVNMGAAAAAPGAIVRVYYEATPDVCYDNPAYDETTLIGETTLTETIAPFGSLPVNLDFWWDTRELIPDVPYHLYIKITHVQDSEGNAEYNTANNFIMSRSDGIVFTQGTVELGVELVMPAQSFAPGDLCYLLAILSNPLQPLVEQPVAVVLDVYSSYFFGPSWALYDPPTSYETDFYRVSIPTGQTILEVLPLFIWPDTGADVVDNLYFYGGILSADLTEILGIFDSVEFGFGP